jgi:hypothetical protein
MCEQASVWAILPETKGVSLERMDKLFGGLDFVEEGEKEMKEMKEATLEDREGATGVPEHRQ